MFKDIFQIGNQLSSLHLSELKISVFVVPDYASFFHLDLGAFCLRFVALHDQPHLLNPLKVLVVN